MRFIAHRGAWWSRTELQNHPSSITSAFAHGWGAEVDVWGSRGEALCLGHDASQYEWTIPADRSVWKEEPLFLHLKTARRNQLWKVRLIGEILRRVDRLSQTYVFWSPDFVGPDPDLTRLGLRYLLPVDNREALLAHLACPVAAEYLSGFWLEQPDDNWVTAEDIGHIQQISKSAWVVSPELHERPVELSAVLSWRQADGICTDVPQLLARIFDAGDIVVHPKQPWWNKEWP